jgi:hypothetical protein
MTMILKLCSKVIATLAMMISVLVLTVLITCMTYFARRTGQPMNLLEFHQLSYIQVLTKRQEAYGQLAHSYQASHSNVKVKAGMCFGVKLVVEITVSWPHSGFYTLAGLFPSLKRYVNPQDIKHGYVPGNVTIVNFLPAWWDTFEKFVLGLIDHVPQGPVAYCRIAAP